jgi:uncharacterized protein (TIGR03435 family)
MKMDFDLPSLDGLAFLQAPKAPPAPPAPAEIAGMKFARIMNGRGDGEYDAGTRALDQHRYDEAVIRFDQVINSKSSRADGALYWKAYALNRAGKKDDALAALTQLHHDYPQSAWLNDAQALETEVKQSSGQPISPAQESNDDLKLLAINSLMHADPERAVPLIENILKGSSPPNVKRNAMFVLTQSRSPRAQQVLNDYAKGGGNPDLQLQAIRYLGQTGSRDAQQQLGGIYGSTTDMRVKSTIIDSLSNTRAWDALLNVAKTEKDTNLRNRAIRTLAENRGAPLEGLLEMYPTVDTSAKTAIIDGLRDRRDAKAMVDLARKETDSQMKRRIVERLGEMRDNKDAMDYMMEILKQKAVTLRAGGSSAGGGTAMSLRIVACIALIAGPAIAQRAAVFETASIKPAAENGHTETRRYPGGRFTATSITLKALIQRAWDVKDFQIAAGPRWMHSELFDVVAKAPPTANASGPGLNQMIQSMLRERFLLEIHREIKDMPIYSLLVAKSGPKLTPTTAAMQTWSRRNGSLVGTKVPMDMLAGDLLESQLRRVVVDHTGIPGEFDIKLKWTPENAEEAGVSLFTAIQEQLGLRLESTHGPVEMLVVDRAERPSEN